MDSLQLLTLYLALKVLHIIFSGRKAKINLHTTPKLTVVIHTEQLSTAMRGSRNFRGGGGGSTST